MKADFCALEAKIDNAQRADQNSGRDGEVKYINSLAEVFWNYPNILSIELEVLLTIEESSTWLLDSGASYHVTPHRSQFRQYSA